MLKQKILLLTLLFVVLSCTTKTLISSTEKLSPIALLQTESLGFVDARPRFREIFCALLNNHGKSLPDYKTCDNSLRTVGLEAKHLPQSTNLNMSNNQFIVGLVPGIAWQCVRNWLNNDNSGPEHVSKQGFDVRLFEVDGLSSSQNNAQQINNYINKLAAQDSKRPIILMGYSKGAVDVLYAISKYPELQKRVVAVVSIAGAIGGSPLANTASQSHLNILSYIPISGCDIGDEKALQSLPKELYRAT